MAAPAEFDPLVDLAGLWNTQLAERYLPIEGMPAAKYECVDGSLYVSPYESSANSYAAHRLEVTFDAPARAAGLLVYGTLNLAFSTGRWLQPDVNILRASAQSQVWIPPELFVMPIELVSPSSRRRDRIDKPAKFAASGIPYYMLVEVDSHHKDVSLALHKLREERYVRIGGGTLGDVVEAEEPFEFSLDLETLLEP